MSDEPAGKKGRHRRAPTIGSEAFRRRGYRLRSDVHWRSRQGLPIIGSASG